MRADQLEGTKTGKFERAVESEYRPLRAFLRSLGAGQSQIEDILQETFLTAFKALDRFDDGKPFGPWLRGIARRKFLEHCRTMKDGDMALGDDLIHAIDAEFAQFDGGAGPDLMSALEKCVGKLDGESERMLKMFYYESKSSQEIADSCGLHDATVRKRLQRAREDLEKCLKDATAA